tara:strand:- start:1278 stop:2051 length:774 start_codon:yes stop_codon:yes gene_type:complete
LAFLGDFGKFFNLGSSKEVLGNVGESVGTFIGGPQGGQIGKSIGRTVARATDNLAGDGNVSQLSTADQALEQSAVPVSQTGDIPQETSMNVGTTGTVQAGFGSVLPSLIGGARSIAPQIGKFLGSPVGSIGTGIATGVGVNMFQGQQMSMGKPVLTQSRRNKAKVRQLVNFMGIEGAAQFLSQASGQNVTGNDVVQLLLRTFRNDGAFITKAQVRNLRRTTNRFKSLEKQVKEATSMTRTTRRPAMRRASSTTLIKN